jgi:tetratricopeptide (TPR) repeat protein
MLAGALTFVLTFTALAAAEESWTDKMVFVTRSGVQLINGRTDGTGRQVAVATLDGLRYRVEAEDGDWIKVRQRGIPGWFPKQQAVLADAALDHFTNEIDANPQDAELYNRRSGVWQHLGRADRSIDDLQKAIQLRPGERAYHNNLGDAFVLRKEYDKAIREFDEAIKLDGKYVRAFDNRGGAHLRKRDYARAASDFEEAVRIDPSYFSAVNNIAWLRATCEDDKCRDGQAAVKYATKACELSAWKEGSVLDTLAAAYAEAGQFDEAVKWQEKALADKETEKRFGSEMRARLRLYQSKKAYREYHDAG